MFNLNGYAQYVIITLNIFYIKTTTELQTKTCSVCDSYERIFCPQKNVPKLFRFPRKKLMKLPYLDYRFQQGCRAK
jgi:hypothetical protein